MRIFIKKNYDTSVILRLQQLDTGFHDENHNILVVGGKNIYTYCLLY